jgi:hypothetical protein
MPEFMKKEISEKSKKLERIDELLQKINRAFISPLMRDSITGQYFFEEVITMLEIVSNEISSDYGEDETKKDQAYRDEINKILLDNPIVVYSWQDSMRGRRPVTIYKFENWYKVKSVIFKYDRFLRESVSSHFKQVSYGEGQEDAYGDDEVVEGENLQ